MWRDIMEVLLRKNVFVVCALLVNATGSLAQLDECGRARLNTKTQGGNNSTPGSWPWQVSFWENDTHICGGSLINRNWILSAAHCFRNINETEITIYLGKNELEVNKTNMQSKDFIQIIPHPNYNSNSYDNDIALVQLSSSVNFSDYIMPVCLAASSSSFPVGTNVWVTGWGNTGNQTFPKPLQEVQMPIVSNIDCMLAYELTDNMICAGQGKKDSCKGDSGGPMVLKQNNTWVQVGIVSFGSDNGCALPNSLAVYTKVSKYQDWINSYQLGFVTVSIGNRGSPALFCLLLLLSMIHFLCSLVFMST